MPTTTTWISAILMGCGCSAVMLLIILKPRFVSAPTWQKLLFVIEFVLSSIAMALVFAFGLQAYRPPVLYAVTVVFAVSWLVARYLQRFGIIAPRTKSASIS